MHGKNGASTPDTTLRRFASLIPQYLENVGTTATIPQTPGMILESRYK